jgi:hypothetical protein
MRKCKEFKVSPTATGSKRVCAKYETVNDDVVMVPENEKADGNLGIVVPEPVAGLGMMAMDDFVGPGVGLLGTGLGAVLARRYGDKLHSIVPEYYGLFGAGMGILASMLTYYTSGRNQMISGVVSSIMLGLGIQFIPRLAEGDLFGCDYRGLGLLTAEPVGYLPGVQDAGGAPSPVYNATDIDAWGRVV